MTPKTQAEIAAALSAPPPKLRTAQYVSEHRLGGALSAEWVLDHVYPRVQLAANCVRYRDADIDAFLEGLVVKGPAR